jgi:lysophospholipase L1-like esterase
MIAVGNAALVVIGCILGLACAEIGYRVYLWDSARQLDGPSGVSNFSVFSSSFWEYDRILGFNYPIDGRTDKTQVANGIPVRCATFVSDSIGNSGRTSAVVDPRTKIFVFGDSFTFVQDEADQGKTWPSLLQNKLNLKPDRHVEVRNYSRDGSGILQMFDAAAATVEKERPNFVIIAFITDDMQRSRYWRTTIREPDGSVKIFTSLDPDLSFADGTYARTAVVDARTNRDWCNRLKDLADRDDPLLKSVIEGYRTALREDIERFGRRPDLFTWRHSFVFAGLRWGDPYRGLPSRQWQPSIALEDFSGDRQFVAAVETLRRSEIPVLLVWLPMFQEMVEGRHIFYSAQQRSLFASLLRTTGFNLLDILPSRPLAESDAAAFYTWPFDLHPSLQGIEFFAEEISRGLEPYSCHLAADCESKRTSGRR